MNCPGTKLKNSSPVLLGEAQLTAGTSKELEESAVKLSKQLKIGHRGKTLCYFLTQKEHCIDL